MTRPTIRLAIITAAVLAAVALAGWWFATRLAEAHLDIEPAELQARMAPHFPVRNCRLIVACLALTNPAVVLAEGDDRVGFTADVKLTAGNREMPGRVGFSGRPRYVRYEGQFFLDDLQITTLELSGVPEEYVAIVKLHGPAVAKAVLQSRPIYTLDGSTTQGALARLAVRDVKVVKGKLRVTFIKPLG